MKEDTFMRLGEFHIKRYSEKSKKSFKGGYMLGGVGLDINVKLTKGQLKKLDKFAKEEFGSEATIYNTPTVTAYLMVVDAEKYNKTIKEDGK